MENIFIKVEEKEYGPVTLDEFKTLAREGSVSRDDLVWSENLDDWISAAQVDELKRFFPTNGKKGAHKCKLYAVASGKGGVGKTVLTCSIGVALSSMGSDVIIVDGDFGGANLHTCMGILEPEYTFFDFYSLQKDTLSQIVLDTPIENLRIISGACGTLGLANPKYFQKQRFIRELKRLPADVVFLDLGAGSSYNTIDFFLLADEKILVVTPEPTSIYEAFGFIKICLMRELNRVLKNFPEAMELIASDEINKPGKTHLTIGDLLQQVKKINEQAFNVFKDVLDNFSPRLILNMVKDDEDLKEGKAIQAAAMELLSIHIEYLGYISYDHEVRAAVKNVKPFLLNNPKSQASKDLSALIRVNLLGKKGVKEILEKYRWRKQIENYAKEFPERADFLQDAPICSMNCFYWGDCEYEDGGKPCRVRHLEPRLKELN
ncbi:DUF4339 domain-containing protein [candidate division KSB1 bacterium]|nr:DUF4339 domain-containing protein [candidate division KSB1 bacterium]